MTESNDLDLAWLARTFSTNGIPDTSHQTLGCCSDEALVREQIRTLRATPGVDAVVVTPHAGGG